MKTQAYRAYVESQYQYFWDLTKELPETNEESPIERLLSMEPPFDTDCYETLNHFNLKKRTD